MYLYLCLHLKSVVDPGFPRGGGANSPGGATYDFAKFSPKPHEIERIWTSRGGACPSRPLRSAAERVCYFNNPANCHVGGDLENVWAVCQKTKGYIDVGEKHTVTSLLPRDGRCL